MNEQGTRYPINNVYADLLPSSVITPDVLWNELQDLLTTRVQTGLFRSPLTAFLYERGIKFKISGSAGLIDRACSRFHGVQRAVWTVREHSAWQGLLVQMHPMETRALFQRYQLSDGAADWAIWGQVIALRQTVEEPAILCPVPLLRRCPFALLLLLGPPLLRQGEEGASLASSH